MKKLLLVLPVVLGLGVLGASTVQHYQTNKPAPVVQVEKSETEKLKREVNEQIAENAKIKNQHNALVVECEKGMKAYEKLNTFQKSQTTVPACASPIE